MSFAQLADPSVVGRSFDAAVPAQVVRFSPSRLSSPLASLCFSL